MRRKSTAKSSKESTSKESIHKESKIKPSKTGMEELCARPGKKNSVQGLGKCGKNKKKKKGRETESKLKKVSALTGGTLSYIPVLTVSTLVASFRTWPVKQNRNTREPRAP